MRVDFGAAYLPQNQDPTLAASTVPGATALLPDQLRPYTGYSSIFYFAPIYHSTYHSIQTSLNRRMRNGLQFGGNYTYSISFNGNAGVQGGTPASGCGCNHNADGSYTVRDDQAQYEKLMSNMGSRPHVIKINAMWELPKLAGDSPAKKALGYVVNDWQLSGVLTAGSGRPMTRRSRIKPTARPINLTGSPSYNGTHRDQGRPGQGCSSDPYKQFNTAAFSGPTYGSLGSSRAATCCWDARTTRWTWPSRATSRSAAAARRSCASICSTRSTPSSTARRRRSCS